MALYEREIQVTLEPEVYEAPQEEYLVDELGMDPEEEAGYTAYELVDDEMDVGRQGCSCGHHREALDDVGFEEQVGATPVTFRFTCATGCHFGNEATCRGVLRTAIRDAIRFAETAAAALEASPRTQATSNRFLRVFGHRPDRNVPWGGGRDSGAIVAVRYRAAARSLPTRVTSYECAAIPVDARVVGPARVLIGPTFWTTTRRHRAAIILHEMMHQYFDSIMRHDANQRRRNNPFCFEVFAFLASGVTPVAGDVTACRSRPA